MYQSNIKKKNDVIKWKKNERLPICEGEVK